MTGSIPPNHYLECDGSVYNISDYPYLAQYIKDQFGVFNFFGGDGINTFSVPLYLNTEYKKVSPTMTSNTTPSPYVVTQSSFYYNNTDLSGYRVFDGIKDTRWATASSQNLNCYVILDMGKAEKFSKMVLTACTQVGEINGTPKNFILYGSNNGIDYDEIISITNQINWAVGEERSFYFNEVSYRYIKLFVTQNNGRGDTTVVSELSLYGKTNINCIKYEPTYFMNIQGLIEETVLWEGNIGTTSSTVTLTSTINLTDSIMNYDMIGLWLQCTKTEGSIYSMYREMPSSIIKDSMDNNITSSFSLGFSNYADYTSILPTSTVSKLIINQRESKLKKIVGIKYKTF